MRDNGIAEYLKEKIFVFTMIRKRIENYKAKDFLGYSESPRKQKFSYCAIQVFNLWILSFILRCGIVPIRYFCHWVGAHK